MDINILLALQDFRNGIGSAAGLLVMWLTMKLMERIEANPKMDIPVMCVYIAIAIAVAVFAALKSYPEDYDAAGKLLVDGAKMAKDTFKGGGALDFLQAGYWKGDVLVSLRTGPLLQG